MAYVPTSHTHPPTANVSVVHEPDDSVPVGIAVSASDEAESGLGQLLSPRQAADERPDGVQTFFGAGGAM